MKTFRISADWLPLVLTVVGILSAPGVHAQGRTNIWEVPLGTLATELPPEFMITACGTNGGPPSTPLRGFHQFEQCTAEPESGLHEVWFSFDDEYEYYLRATNAHRFVIEDNRANKLLGQLVIYSILLDAEGLVQGHRIASDTREDPEVRVDSDKLEAMRVFGYGAAGFECSDLPRLEGEMPFGGIYTKKLCEKVDGGRYITILTHRFLRAGQQAARPGAPLANEFEVGVWIEVINADLVGKGAPN